MELWPQFHLFRIEELPQIWKKSQKVVEDIDIILAQKATMEYVLLLLQEKYSRNKEESSPKERKEILPDEANAIRYVAGYVIKK